MLPVRTVIQRRKGLHPNDERVFSSYQSEFSQNNHGNLISHYGNSAYLDKTPVYKLNKPIRPFLSASYRNLNQDSFVANRFSDGLVNNYRTSDDNVLKRELKNIPEKTKLDHLFITKTSTIGHTDKASIYEQKFLNQRENDYFTSKKLLKTETVNLRDKTACLMELGDYIRNKSFDINSRNLFSNDSNGFNELDVGADLFTQLIGQMETLILSYDRLRLTGEELKQMMNNFEFSEKITEKNLWERDLKPDFERIHYKDTEDSLKAEKQSFITNREISLKRLNQIQSLLEIIENFTHKTLDEIFEEAKVSVMSKLSKPEYEIFYLRDSTGYIKQNPKLPMKFSDWTNLAQNGIHKLNEIVQKATEMNNSTKQLIQQIAKSLSNQWMKTHQRAYKDIDNGLNTQSKLITTQYDLKKEMEQLNSAMEDCRLKTTTCQMENEASLTKLRPRLYEIDPFNEEHRKKLSTYANETWSNRNDLTHSLKGMITYRKDLSDRIQRLDKNIHSNHAGINHDLKTLIEPRRNVILVNPSVGLAKKSQHLFN